MTEGTDQLRVRYAERMDPWEAQPVLVRLAKHFLSATTMIEDDFDRLVAERPPEVDSDTAEGDGYEDESANMAAASVDPEWEKRYLAQMNYGIEHGGEDDPRGHCIGALNIKGQHYACDYAEGHDGWAHGNKELGAIWR